MKVLVWLKKRITIPQPARPAPHAIIRVPWSTEQVEQLNRYQRLEGVHPYTCGSRHERRLLATPEGWRCPTRDCEYRQEWALESTADRRTLDGIAETVRQLPTGRKE